MSNMSNSSTEQKVVWRKRIPLKAETLKRLEDEAKASARTPNLMAAYIIEEFFKPGRDHNG